MSAEPPDPETAEPGAPAAEPAAPSPPVPAAAEAEPGAAKPSEASKLGASKPGAARPGARERSLKLGWPVAFAYLWAIVWAAPFALLVVPLPSLPELLARGLTIGSSADLVLSLVLGALALWRALRVAPGTQGRARTIVVATTSFGRALALGGVSALVIVALSDTSVGSLATVLTLPPDLRPPMLEMIETLSFAQDTWIPLLICAGLGAAALVVSLVFAISGWFLVPPPTRTVVWLIVDVLLFAGFIGATLLLPLRPPEAPPSPLEPSLFGAPPGPRTGDVTLPAIRLAITALAILRLLMRLLPPVLNGLEGAGFQLLVAARMLRARKSGFLTAIGALSILAVSFSSCTLTTTLSVMGGFRNDLKRKILGHNAHVVIDREHGTFEDWQPVLDSTRAQPGVIGATPYVGGEVMITSATNLAGAILRGIDPASIGQVSDLPRSLRAGRLEHLVHPEQLLRPRSTRIDRPGREDGPPFEGERGSLVGDIDQALDEGLGEPSDPELARIRREIEEALGPAPPARGIETSQEVLPGLIVGQELARNLRLHVGDEVNVVSPLGELGPAGPMPKTRPFRVAGIFYSGMYEYDMKLAYTTLDAAQRFLNTGEGISGIEIKVDDVDRAEDRALGIASAIARPELRVRGWQEVNRNLFGALALEKLAMFITLGIAILVASFCIVGTLTLMVQEKGREVGILKAMGARSGQIVAVFMLQGLMIGVLGAMIGLGLGYVACFAAEHFGVIPMNPEVYYIDRLPVHIDPVEFSLVGVASVAIALLATIYPAILGSRLQPVDALRYA